VTFSQVPIKIKERKHSWKSLREVIIIRKTLIHTHTHTNVHAHVHTNSFLDIMSLPYHQHDQQPSLTHFRLCEINSWHWWVQMALSFCLSWVTNCKQPNRKRCPSNGVLSSHVDSPGQTLPCLLIQTPFLDGLSIISPQKMMWFFNKDFSVL
jgi:hypothetical protein